MRRRNEKRSLPETSLLKIDKDCFCEAELNRKYIQTIIHTCRKQNVRVLWVRFTFSRHGMHYYIKIDPPLEPEIANDLQYLLGDDAKRHAFNRARMKSGIAEWNKLFERIGAILRIVYRAPGITEASLRFCLY